MEKIIKEGTLEELQEDLRHENRFVSDKSLEEVMSVARMQIDNAMQSILAESKLPLFLFDFLISSVQNDIRKAALDYCMMEGNNKCQ